MGVYDNITCKYPPLGCSIRRVLCVMEPGNMGRGKRFDANSRKFLQARLLNLLKFLTIK